MANIYYERGEQRAQKVQELFARIAPRYDLVNDLQSFGLHRYWKSQVVRLARPRPGGLELDICCGTGDLTFAFAGQGVTSVGLDFSEQMLKVAQTRNQARLAHGLPLGSGSPRFIRGDAQKIPFRPNSFDTVTVGYGLRNLADWRLGLAEIYRVLNPGGRLLVLDFGKPENALWRGLYFGYLRLFVPLLGTLCCGSAGAYAYILESLKNYPAQHGVAAAMRDLGFANVRIIRFLGGVMTINYGEKAPS